MADKSQHLNNKRSHKSDRQDPSPEQNPEKRQNLDRDENSESDNPSEKKTITNIYYDCLERIFDFLDLESLLMVAQTCKRLQIAANAKIGDDFGNKGILIRPFTYTRFPQPPSIQTTPYESIVVNSWKSCFPFLRCFGSKIRTLTIVFQDSSDTCIGHFHRYIRQYCADTLILLHINNNPTFSIQIYECKPFKNVQELRLMNVGIHDELQEFVLYFPLLRRLSMNRVAINENATNVLFPYLIHLEIELNHNSDHRLNRLTKVGATHLLRANPQIQSLEITTITLTLDEIMDMISDNPLIKSLSLDVKWKFTDIHVIQLNRFEKLHLHSTNEYTTDEAMALIQQLNSLNFFVFTVGNQTESDRLLGQLDNNKWQHKHMQISMGHIFMILSRRI